MTCETIEYNDLSTQVAVGNDDEVIVVVNGQPLKMTVANFLSNVSSQNEPIELAVSGSETYLVGENGFLDHIVLITTGSNSIKVGTTANGNEIDESIVDPSSPLTLSIFLFFNSQTNLHFTGNCTVKLYFR